MDQKYAVSWNMEPDLYCIPVGQRIWLIATEAQILHEADSFTNVPVKGRLVSERRSFTNLYTPSKATLLWRE